MKKGKILSDISPQVRKTKEKNKQMGLFQIKRFLHKRGDHQQNKNAAHGVGEHI